MATNKEWIKFSIRARIDAYLRAVPVVGVTFIVSLLGIVIVALIIRTGFGWPLFFVTIIAVSVAAVGETIYQSREYRGR